MALSRWNSLILALLIFTLALIPRVLPRDILTIDETFHWVGRSERFLAALQAGDLRNTAQAFHPGVATTWLGAAGILLSRALYGPDIAASNYFVYVNAVRIPVAIVNTISIVISYWLLRRLLNARIAFLAALLWAAEPFIVAHSAILHVDALSMSLMVVSLLCGWYALRLESLSYHSRNPVRWPFLILSAVVGGFAILTKFTTLFLFPMIVVHSRFSTWRNPLRPPAPVMAMAVWLLLAGIVWFGFYPATWSNMDYVIAWLRHGADLALSPHNAGNFFMGQPVENPGILFYVMAILLRLTPWSLVGLLVSLVALFKRDFRPYRKVAVSMLFVVVTFVVLMTAQPKKFDRYIIQIFPILLVMASCGLVWLGDHIQRWLQNRTHRDLPAMASAATWSVLLVVMVLNLAWYHPYYLSYYDPLLGGGPTAVRTILVGWGEGLEQAGAFIRDQNKNCEYPVMGYMPEMGVLHQFLPCVVEDDVSLDTLQEPGYLVLYVSMIQRQKYTQFEEAMRGVDPVFSVNIHGIEYARVYDVADLHR